MTTPTKPDLVALADDAFARIIRCYEKNAGRQSEKLEDIPHIARRGQESIRRLASQPSLYEAGLREEGTRYRHKKRGSTYTVIGRGHIQGERLEDMMPMIIYRGDADGLLWARPEDEFNDGRFERIAALPADGGTAQSQPFDVMMTIDPDFAESFERNENFESQQHCEQPSDTRTPSTAGSVREALEPFARIARLLDADRDERTPDSDVIHKQPGYVDVKITMGDCRAAERALSAPVEAPVAVKLLEWTDPIKPNERCSYDHVKAQSSIGEYSVEWKGWKDHPGYAIYRDGDYFADVDNSLDAAKAAAQRDYETRIRSALIATPRPLPSVDDVKQIIDKHLRSIPDDVAETLWFQERDRAATAILTLLGGSAQ